MVSKEFLMAGDAIFTIECPDGSHRTYRVQHVPANDRYPETWFVKLFVGSENSDPRSYAYLGKLLTHEGQCQTTAKSCRPADHYDVRLLNRVLARVWTGDHAAYEQHGYRTHHEGRCGKCGRRLTVPESIEEGIGPECRKSLGMAPLARAKATAKPETVQPAFPQSSMPESSSQYRAAEAIRRSKESVFEFSDLGGVPAGFAVERDGENEITCWTGSVPGRKGTVTILND